ncbi:MAG: hypothetical protein JSS46_08765 [Proteobacteria bacterium]|nr:hypothetical protein [Pseudomonadota bacterium]
MARFAQAAAFAALVSLTPWAAAQTGGAVSTQTSAPGMRSVSSAVEIVASVAAIDKAHRSVTLRMPGGQMNTIEVGPEVRNFDRIKVGDRVAARYVQAVTLELRKADGGPVARVESAGGIKAKPGERPAAGAGREVRVSAEIIALDPSTQVATLRGPKRTIEVRVADPEQFKLAKVGDRVEATYVEALAISVEPVNARK